MLTLYIGQVMNGLIAPDLYYIIIETNDPSERTRARKR